MQKDGPYEGFQSVEFGVNSDISVGEDRLHLGECVFVQSSSFLYFCVSHMASGVIKKPIWNTYFSKQTFEADTCYLIIDSFLENVLNVY